MPSIEEKVEELYKKVLDDIGLRHFAKTESINKSIDEALKAAESKSGGKGNNYPDIKCLIDNRRGRSIPVMIEAKGSANKLEKLDKEGNIVGVTEYKNDTKTHKKGDPNYSVVQGYAVNGALHYGLAVLDGSDYKEVIIIGVNGSVLNSTGEVTDQEYKAYYISEKNHRLPKIIDRLDASWSLLAPQNTDALYAVLDDLNLTEKEREKLKEKTEAALEERIQKIHQAIYDDVKLRTALSTNEKLYLFCGLIMAGLKSNIAPLRESDFRGNNSEAQNDGTIILNQISSFLLYKNCSAEKSEMITSLLTPVFKNKALWKPENGESTIKWLFIQIQKDIIPCLESDLHLDFAGKILNKLSDWVSIDNDARNDVVLTPRYVTSFMARLARTNMDSFVWDKTMGSAGFLVSAMDIMIRDAQSKIGDPQKLQEKIRKIKEEQLLGIEILGNIYVLAFLNMVLAGDGISNIVHGDGHAYNGNFPATVFLLNPPYSAPGKGFNFVEETLKQMTEGYAAILIQENAGSGQGLPYTKRILKNNTLIASISMPTDLFGGRASVKTAIYLFQVARPHEEDDVVMFIDMSNDGYARQNRKKSSQSVNLRDVDNAKGRYEEVVARLTGKMPKTDYYTEENGLLIGDTISLEGDDWTFNQHKVIDNRPTESDFRKTVASYLSFRVSQILKEEGSL